MRTLAPLLFTICHRTHRMQIAESIDFGKAPQLAITLANCSNQAAQATPKGLAPPALCYCEQIWSKTFNNRRSEAVHHKKLHFDKKEKSASQSFDIHLTKNIFAGV